MKYDRSISLNAAIDAIEKCTDIYLNNLPPTIYKEDAIKAVKALPSAQPGWIPVTEKLPTENNSYLVWMPFAPEGHHITVAEWCGSYWNIKTPITAWMPLPAPYIPEGDDKHEG